ncbi:hypothetical protein ACIRG5_00810 [Lentzea sp. NPDC102401]|uniref:hypothetical protein n=1 Tax=Lentzea sp. NPDC102401 TaxID=3364128 RepID=UPI0037FAFA70
MRPRFTRTSLPSSPRNWAEPVRFDPVAAEQWRGGLVELSAVDDVVNACMAGHITSVTFREFARGP